MNAITTLGTQSVNYDVKGNQTSNINGNTYYWDELNRFIEIKDICNATIALYYYNTDNYRVEKITSAGTEQYYYCGARVCVETDGSQTVTKEYIHGGQYIDEIINIITGGDPYFYLYDLRFNMYALIDDSGNVAERARYEGYGKQELMDDTFFLVGSPLVDQPFSYTGQRLDIESGLQYYRARYFDNDMGRFISRDPIGYVDGLNLYGGYFIQSGVDWSGKINVKFVNKNIGDCGNANATFKIELDNKPETDGFIVQEITWILTVIPCVGSSTTTHGTFYEAFYVEAGNKETYLNAHADEIFERLKNTNMNVDKKFIKNVTDIASSGGSHPKSKGFYYQIGTLKWVPRSVSGELGNRFSNPETIPNPKSGFLPASDPNHQAGAGSYPASDNEPKWWGTVNTTEKDASKSFIVLWDCCCENTFTRVSTTPK